MRGEEAGDDQDDVDADEASARPPLEVVGEHGQNGHRAQTKYVESIVCLIRTM